MYLLTSLYIHSTIHFLQFAKVVKKKQIHKQMISFSNKNLLFLRICKKNTTFAPKLVFCALFTILGQHKVLRTMRK